MQPGWFYPAFTCGPPLSVGIEIAILIGSGERVVADLERALESDYLKEARRCLDRLIHIAENLGVRSDDAIDCYFKIDECYSNAPPHEQPIVFALKQRADEIWPRLTDTTTNPSG